MQTAKTRSGVWGLVLMSGMLATSALASNWTNDAAGVWSLAGNWTGGVPNAIGAVAGLAVPAGIAADRTVTLDTNASVGTLTFSDAAAPANSWTVAQGGANTLTMDVASGSAAITVNQGTANAINVPITFNDYTNINVATGNRLTLGGNLTGAAGIRVYLQGNGTFRFAGNGTGFTGQYRLNPGGATTNTLEIANDNALGTATLIPEDYGGKTNFVNVSGGTLNVGANWGQYQGAEHNLSFSGGDFNWTGTWDDSGGDVVVWNPASGVTLNLSGLIAGNSNANYQIGGAGGTVLLTGTNSGTAKITALRSGAKVGIGADNILGPASNTINTSNAGIELFAVGGPHTVQGTLQISAHAYSSSGNLYTFSGTNDLTFTGDMPFWQTNGGPIFNVTGTGLATLAGAFTGTLDNAGCAIAKQGTGTLALTGSNSAFTRTTRIDAGALRAQDGTGLSASSWLQLNGGVLEANGTFGRALGASGSTGFSWASGGFASKGGVLSVDVGNDGASNLVWNGTANYLTGTMVLNSVTADNAVTLVDNINLNGAVRTIRVLDNAGSATDKAVIAGIISGTGVNSGMIKDGAGILELTMANSYQGATTISGGKLTVTSTGSINTTSGITLNGGELNYNSATPLTKPITFTSGKLSGTGTIGTAVTVGSGAVINPGNSPGLQSYTSGLTWNGGGTYQWEINAKTGTAGTDWDKINVTGGLTLGATSGNPFNIGVVGLAGVGTAPLVYMTWPALTFDTLTGGFDPSKFSLTASGFDGSWSPYNWRVLNVGNDVLVMYLPEPTSLVLLAGAGLCVLRRRRA